ncbi:microtubule-associated protein 9 isoform X2 [Cyrtonyx montezumae]|uniref:microtubule-associated protein 9 isoform X2 n=1 Tax=Cyrtonyx montezumae TaxID=9017 RepID=UPI0032DA4A45
MSRDGAVAAGPRLESTSPPFFSTPHDERLGESCSLLCGEAPSEKDEREDVNISDLKLEDNSKTVVEATTTTVHEKTKLEESTDDSSDEKERIVQEPVVTAAIQVSVDSQSEHGKTKNTSEDSVEKQSGAVKAVLQSSKSSSCKFLSSSHLKEKVKAVPTATTVPPQYLGTLKVLEFKHLKKNSAEFDKADSLRAAVFQNWVEKKRAFLLELKRAEKKKAEELRSDAEKKEAVKREEANASFKTWKAMKAREAKNLNDKKKKLEKLKEKKAAEQNAEKAEAAQKAFEKWKEKKTEHLREQSKREEQSERIRKKKEEELAAEKKRDSISAVEKWNDKKKEYMKQKKAEAILERRQKKIQQAEKDEKDKMAIEEYGRWLEKIKRREQLEKKQKNLQAVHRDETSFPWIPPGKVTYTKNY